jgi:hypothetical protein
MTRRTKGVSAQTVLKLAGFSVCNEKSSVFECQQKPDWLEIAVAVSISARPVRNCMTGACNRPMLQSTTTPTVFPKMPQLSHMVYFTLHEASEAKVQELVDACKKYLDDHPGLLYFSVGRLNKELARPVNDHGYEVTINVVFDSRASHDLYQTAPRHLQFIAEQKANWKQVRVFDSDLA